MADANPKHPSVPCSLREACASVGLPSPAVPKTHPPKAMSPDHMSNEPNAPPQLLIDADGYLYKATAAAEFEGDWGDGVIVLSTNIEQAKEAYLSMMETISRDLGSDDLVMVLSGSRNFRYALDPTYKSNRKGTRKPLGYRAMVDWLYERYPGRVLRKEILEADDYLGILSTTPGSIDRIVVSEDKDLLTIPGKLYRAGSLLLSQPSDANRAWLTQTLTGDPSDGYKGCPGVGAVKAGAILGKPGSPWENVRQAYLKAGLTEEDAILQARLARILRHGDWDREAQQVRLWTPSDEDTIET